MKRAEALRLLNLPEQAKPFTREAVAIAFCNAVKASHPDTGGEGADMDQLRQARNFLVLNLNGQNNACVQCRGRGMVQARVGMRPCGACKGTGDKNG